MTAKRDIVKTILVFCSGGALIETAIQAITLRSRRVNNPISVFLERLKNGNAKGA